MEDNPIYSKAINDTFKTEIKVHKKLYNEVFKLIIRLSMEVLGADTNIIKKPWEIENKDEKEELLSQLPTANLYSKSGDLEENTFYGYEFGILYYGNKDNTHMVNPDKLYLEELITLMDFIINDYNEIYKKYKL